MLFCFDMLPALAQTPLPAPQLSIADLQKLAQEVNSGDVRAQAQLGAMYVLGSGGVPQNYGYAYFWLTLAAQRGDPEFESTRKEVAQLLTPDTVAALQAKARSWTPGTSISITPDTAPQGPPPASVTASSLPFFTKMVIRLKAFIFNHMTSY